jgi:vesicle-associated membrane protein 7
MSDQKLRCALAYRIDPGNTVVLAKFDHASQYETHGGAPDETSLYGGKDKSYAEAVAKVIENDPPGGLAEAGQIGGFKVVQSDQHQVVYGADADRICLAVITGLGYPSRVAIQMLQELYKSFMEEYGQDAKTASVDALTKKAKNMLKESCEKYDDLSKVDKTHSLLGKVDQAKSSMQSNIANMLKNTEAADSLAAKSDQLNEQASVFKKKSGDLKKSMAWKNLKMALILGGIVVLLLIIIIVPLIKRAK